MPRKIRTAAIALAALLTATACAGGGGTGEGPAENQAGGPTTLVWWHNATQGDLRDYFQGAADRFMATHPDVTIQVEPTQNEEIQTKIRVGLQSNDPPDIFQQWGGGDLATQVESGKVADITDATSEIVGQIGPSAEGWQVDGRQYGLPYSVGVVGFWYRTDLFAQAGITAPPTTMDEFYGVIDRLRNAGITPIALGGRDEWPDAFYWGYLATRECSRATLQAVTADLELTDPCFIRAGEGVQRLLAANPFQEGFLATPAQSDATSAAAMIANGTAAMELQGHWEAGEVGNLTADGQPLGERLGWFPFPEVPGGQGEPGATLGGGDGFSCSAAAPPVCAEFLNFLISAEEQLAFAATNSGLPVNPAAEGSVTDPTVQGVLEARNTTPYNQLYFDKALPTDVGLALNSEVAALFAGESSPQQIITVATEAAAASR